jgi:autotransporter-associated beta strand protein
MNSSDPFVDSINENRVITANGTAAISTEIKYAGAASLSLGPAELEPISYLSTPHNSDFDLSGDFTIDFYIYPTAIPSAGFAYIFITSQSTDGFFITWDQYDNDTINIGQVGTADILTSIDLAPINEWTRVTITRELDLIKIFINSVLSSSVENSTNFTSDSSNEARFGEGENVGAGAGFIGYIDEFKLINGTAVNPTPPPPPTPSITPTITKTKTPTPTVTKTPTPSFTPMTIDICQSGPIINLGSGRSTGYYNYVGSGCITNRVINLSGSTGGATLISSGSGPLIFTSNVVSSGIGNKAFTIDGTNTGRNRINRLRDPSPGGGANGRVRLVKDGSGSWEITGASGNYSGGTTILQGKLIVGGANVSGVANGPLGIGSVSLGSSSPNLVNTKAAILLEEGVTFNRTLNINHYRDTSQEVVLSTDADGRTYRTNQSPYQEVIIGGANTSGTCAFGSSWNIIPNHSGNISDITFQQATGGTLNLGGTIGFFPFFGGGIGTNTKVNTNFYFGTPDNSGTISVGSILERNSTSVTNVIIDYGNVIFNSNCNIHRGITYIRNGTFILKVVARLGSQSCGVFGSNDVGAGRILLGDNSDPGTSIVNGYMGKPKQRTGAGTGEVIFAIASGGYLGIHGDSLYYQVIVPQLYNQDNQRVIFESRADTQTGTFTVQAGRDISIRAQTNTTLKWNTGFLNEGAGYPFYTTYNIIIGESGYLGTVEYNGGFTLGSIIIRDGLCRTANHNLFVNEIFVPFDVNNLEDGEIVAIEQPVVIDGTFAELNYNGHFVDESNTGSLNRSLNLIKGTLSGAGIINCPHAISIGSGATLRPGNYANWNWYSTSTATGLSQIYSSGLYLNSGGKLRVDIINSIGSLAGGTDYNQAVVPNSGVFINSTESEPFVIEINCPNTMDDNSFIIISNSGTLDNFDSNKFNIVNNNPLVSGTFSLTSSESDIILNYIAPIETQNLFQLHFDELNINNNYDDTGKYSLQLIPSGSTSLDIVEKVVGSGSVNFNGGYLNSSSGNLINLGQSKFTVDFWIRPDSVGNHTRGIIDLDTNYYSNRFAIVVRPNGIIGIDNNTSLISANSGLTANEWHHVAIVRENSYNNKTVIYLNGIPDSTGTVSTNFLQSQINIGRTWAGENFVGNLDEFRIIKEVMYTGVFVPPS